MPVCLLQGGGFAEIEEDVRAVQSVEWRGVLQVSQVGEEWHAVAEGPFGLVAESCAEAVDDG